MRGDLDKKRREEAKQMRKQAHWMKCPKCGFDLTSHPLSSGSLYLDTSPWSQFFDQTGRLRPAAPLTSGF